MITDCRGYVYAVRWYPVEITAGCRRWRSFEEAYRHYSPAWAVLTYQPERLFTNKGEWIRTERVRLRAIKILKTLERRVRKLGIPDTII